MSDERGMMNKLVLVFVGLLLAACGAAPVEPAAAPVLSEAEVDAASAPDDDEPVLTVDLTIEDDVTGVPVVGDVVLLLEDGDGDGDVQTGIMIGAQCVQVTACVVEIPDESPYRVVVFAPGYVAWALEITPHLVTDKVLAGPARLVKEG